MMMMMMMMMTTKQTQGYKTNGCKRASKLILAGREDEMKRGDGEWCQDFPTAVAEGKQFQDSGIYTDNYITRNFIICILS
jgi:hypothetical protein